MREQFLNPNSEDKEFRGIEEEIHLPTDEWIERMMK